MGDRRGRLRGEQPEDLLVLVGEWHPARLLDQVEVADMHAAMVHRGALEGLHRQQVPGQADGAHEGGEVREPWVRQVTQVLEQLRAAGPCRHGLVFLVGDPGSDEVLGRTRLINCDDRAVAGAGQRLGALHDLAEHGVEVEARADAQQRLGQTGEARGCRLGRMGELIVMRQASSSPGTAATPAVRPVAAARSMSEIHRIFTVIPRFLLQILPFFI